MQGSRLVHRKRYNPAAEHAIWRVSWECPPDIVIAPFPVRVNREIHYPAIGTGTYHAAEVRAAILAGYDVTVIEGWVLQTKPGTPFDWIPTVYRYRAELQKQGHAAQKVLKLGLNSVYGKLAQGYGFRGNPPWQCYFWAGEITSRTRARILELATKAKNPVMIATDGIFAERFPSPGSQRSILGSWEPGIVDELFAAQPGVYHGYRGEQEILKSRGFFAREVDYDALRTGWEVEREDHMHTYVSKRFVGLGAALMRTNGLEQHWRKWIEAPRSIVLTPRRKNIGGYGPQGENILTPPREPLISEPYVPKQSLFDKREDPEFEMGIDQPLREDM